MTVFFSFLRPVAHLAFDDSWVDSIATRFHAFFRHFAEQVGVPAIQTMRVARRLGQTAAKDLQGIHERELRGAQSARVAASHISLRTT